MPDEPTTPDVPPAPDAPATPDASVAPAVPDAGKLAREAMNRPVTRQDVCYLLERYGAYETYNAADLTPQPAKGISSLWQCGGRRLTTDGARISRKNR